MVLANIAKELSFGLKQLVLFANLAEDPVVDSFGVLLESFIREDNEACIARRWALFLRRLYAPESMRLWRSSRWVDPWRAYLMSALVGDENAFTLWAETHPEALYANVPGDLRALAEADLAILAAALTFDLGGLSRALGLWMPDEVWEQGTNSPESAAFEEGGGVVSDAPHPSQLALRITGRPSPGELGRAVLGYCQEHGAGLMNRYLAFRWQAGAARGLVGIPRPDPVSFADLVGYEWQREMVLGNTRQFLSGLPANNMLLYGDRGTGKSSTVKALLAEFAGTRLRMVEVAKGDLGDFPNMIRQLAERGMRFIVFIDDLSFEEHEAEYKHLKALLEGGLERRPDNVLIYATSNRRHLVREYSQDSGEPAATEVERAFGERRREVRPGDTVEEKLSLADRFGMTVVFNAPARKEYLTIVKHLARRDGLDIPEDELADLAQRWLLWHNGPSGRTARQFVDALIGQRGLQRNGG